MFLSGGPDGALYVARNQPIDPDTMVHGECRRGFPRCGYPQDLYFDGRPLRAVAKKAKVKPGRALIRRIPPAPQRETPSQPPRRAPQRRELPM